MAEGVKYIKIAKIDGDGVDQTLTLQSLTDLTIPYSTGNVTYDILSISEQPTYFLYSVDNPNIEHADRALLKYDVTASLDSVLLTVGSPPIVNPRTVKLTTITDNQGFLEDFSDQDTYTSTRYKFKTYPQKIINLQASGSLSIGSNTGNNHKIFLAGPDDQQIGNAITVTGTGEKNFNVSASIDYSSSFAGNHFSLKFQNTTQLATPTCNFSSSARFFITTTDASGPTMETIPEPFFTQDFSRAFDCQPTFNNVINNRQSTVYQDIDYNSGVYIPTNFDLIINGKALKASVQDSNYSSLRHINPRYLGSKNQSSNFNVYNSTAGTSSFGTPINIGTYGRTPSVSVLDSTIYEFEYGGGTTPEILGWGGLKLGNILQVSSKDSIRSVKGSEGATTRLISSRKPDAFSTSRNYRMVLSDDQTTVIYPPQSVATSSIGSDYFWLTPQTYTDYYQILNSNNPVNHRISLNMYPNLTAGSDPTLPKTSKVVTTEFGVPTISNFALTSSNNVDLTVGSSTVNNYGFIRNNNRAIYLYRNKHISRVTTDDNGFYQGGGRIKPSLQGIVSTINKDLNNGERWFVTLFNEFEFPNNKGDYNTNLSSGSLTPYNVGYSGSDSSGNYPDPLAYKGVYEIVGAQDTFTNYTYLLIDKPIFGTRNIGGNGEANTPITPFNGIGSITGPGLGMLIWKARATGKNEFIIVQDEITGGVAKGAFISTFPTQDVIDNFDYITKTYGKNS